MRIRLSLAVANLAALTLMSRPGTLDGQRGVLPARHGLYRLEADLRWIEHTADRLDLLKRAVRQ
jgi:hypothetical protein